MYQLILTDKVGLVKKAYQMTRPAHDINQSVNPLWKHFLQEKLYENT